MSTSRNSLRTNGSNERYLATFFGASFPCLWKESFDV